MGEAKHRKQTDPNYGRVPKTAKHRGLIVSAPLEIEGNTLHVKSPGLDPQELRFGLLFWDQLVWPSSRSIYFASGSEEQFLETAGVLTRPDYTIHGDVATGIAKGQFKAFSDRDAAEPGGWAMSQGESSFLWKDSPVTPGDGATVELHRAIPIPQHDVPLAEILEFKHRRGDELLLLRHHLETFVLELEASQNKLTELKARIAEIDQACANLLVVGKEWQFPIYLSNFKASFSLSPLKFLPATAGGWKLGESYGLTAATAAAAASGAISTLEIKGDFGLRSVRRPMNPFRYAYLAQEELK
jgi:Family of unknown function (DUF6236)